MNFDVIIYFKWIGGEMIKDFDIDSVVNVWILYIWYLLVSLSFEII